MRENPIEAEGESPQSSPMGEINAKVVEFYGSGEPPKVVGYIPACAAIFSRLGLKRYLVSAREPTFTFDECCTQRRAAVIVLDATVDGFGPGYYPARTTPDDVRKLREFRSGGAIVPTKGE